jgi:poly-gamma-glutamate capsule biosynthesis protein CapA/YwtB (metallophosphatase superfamily)
MAEIQAAPTQAGNGRAAARAERRAARLAKQITAFAKSHGGAAEGQIAYIGEAGARIVLVGENGEWGDLVAPTYDIARSAVERSGITTHESFDGDLAGKVRTGRYEWSRMAGIQIGGPANT